MLLRPSWTLLRMQLLLQWRHLLLPTGYLLRLLLLLLPSSALHTIVLLLLLLLPLILLLLPPLHLLTLPQDAQTRGKLEQLLLWVRAPCLMQQLLLKLELHCSRPRAPDGPASRTTSSPRRSARPWRPCWPLTPR